MKNKSVNILVVSLLLLGLVAVMLTVFLGGAKEKFPESITVSEDGVTESILAVRDLKLNPTESKEYSVSLVCDASGLYNIQLDYEEKNDGGMKPFVDVIVKLDGSVIYEGGLAELLDNDGEPIRFECELNATEPLVVSFCYSMPYDIGNEAQGTYADFDINLKIEKS